MRIGLCMDNQELRGTQAISFELYDTDWINQGTLIIGKAAYAIFWTDRE